MGVMGGGGGLTLISKHWFTTSFPWRYVTESDARSAAFTLYCYASFCLYELILRPLYRLVELMITMYEYILFKPY